jgi:hypothetical protein
MPKRFRWRCLSSSDDHIIFDQLVRDFREESKREYVRIANELHQRGAEGLVLGCTEIFLLLNQVDVPDFPLFDTTELHVDAAVAFVLALTKSLIETQWRRNQGLATNLRRKHSGVA